MACLLSPLTSSWTLLYQQQSKATLAPSSQRLLQALEAPDSTVAYSHCQTSRAAACGISWGRWLARSPGSRGHLAALRRHRQSGRAQKLMLAARQHGVCQLFAASAKLLRQILGPSAQAHPASQLDLLVYSSARSCLEALVPSSQQVCTSCPELS